MDVDIIKDLNRFINNLNLWISSDELQKNEIVKKQKQTF